MYPIIRSCGLGVPLAAALLAGPGIASAATFDYGSYSVVNEVNVHINPGSGTPALPTGFEYGYFGSGQIVLYGTGSNGGQTLDVWCIDATHILQNSDTYTIISPPFTNSGNGVGGSTLTSTQLGEIGALVRWGDANITTSWVSAAVQLAIWVIEYPGATFTSDSGTVNTEVPILVSDAENQTRGFTWYYGLREVIDPIDNQGLVFTPLPSTWTLMLCGFAGLGLFAYRGAKNRSAAVA